MPHRKRGLAAESLRGRLALLAVVLAALAGMGQIITGPHEGIVEIGVGPEGTLIANVNHPFDYPYVSLDGGFTWICRLGLQRPEICLELENAWKDALITGEMYGGELVPLAGQDWWNRQVRTPSGDYFIVEDPHILRVDGASGSQEVVYSFAYLQNAGNRWMQVLDRRDISYVGASAEPRNLFYDAQSGNLLAAMGPQGVVVIAPDGTATRVAVGRYSPTDFSLAGKVRMLVGSLLHGWSAANTGLAFLLTFSFATLALAFPTAGAFPRAALVIAAGVSAYLAATVGVYPLALQDWGVIRVPWEFYIHGYAWRPLVFSGFGLLPFLLTVAGLIFANVSRKQVRSIAAASLGMLPLLGLGSLVLFEAGPTLANVVAVGLVALTSFGLLLHRMRARKQEQPASIPARSP